MWEDDRMVQLYTTSIKITWSRRLEYKIEYRMFLNLGNFQTIIDEYVWNVYEYNLHCQKAQTFIFNFIYKSWQNVAKQSYNLITCAPHFSRTRLKSYSVRACQLNSPGIFQVKADQSASLPGRLQANKLRLFRLEDSRRNNKNQVF